MNNNVIQSVVIKRNEYTRTLLVEGMEQYHAFSIVLIKEVDIDDEMSYIVRQFFTETGKLTHNVEFDDYYDALAYYDKVVNGNEPEKIDLL